MEALINWQEHFKKDVIIPVSKMEIDIANYALSVRNTLVTVSSTFSASYPASSLINGDRTHKNWGGKVIKDITKYGGWMSTGNIDEWVKLNFQVERKINRLEIFFYPVDCKIDNLGFETQPRKMTVQHSLDGIEWFDWFELNFDIISQKNYDPLYFSAGMQGGYYGAGFYEGGSKTGVLLSEGIIYDYNKSHLVVMDYAGKTMQYLRLLLQETYSGVDKFRICEIECYTTQDITRYVSYSSVNRRQDIYFNRFVGAQLDFSLLNFDNRFSLRYEPSTEEILEGYFNNEIKPDMRLRVYGGYDNLGMKEYKELGTFYVSSWNTGSKTKIVTVVARDRLKYLINKYIDLGVVLKDKTVEWLLEYAGMQGNISADEMVLANTYTEVRYFFPQLEDTAWLSMQKLAEILGEMFLCINEKNRLDYRVYLKAIPHEWLQTTKTEFEAGSNPVGLVEYTDDDKIKVKIELVKTLDLNLGNYQEINVVENKLYSSGKIQTLNIVRGIRITHFTDPGGEIDWWSGVWAVPFRFLSSFVSGDSVHLVLTSLFSTQAYLKVSLYENLGNFTNIPNLTNSSIKFIKDLTGTISVEATPSGFRVDFELYYNPDITKDYVMLFHFIPSTGTDGCINISYLDFDSQDKIKDYHEFYYSCRKQGLETYPPLADYTLRFMNLGLYLSESIFHSITDEKRFQLKTQWQCNQPLYKINFFSEDLNDWDTNWFGIEENKVYNFQSFISDDISGFRLKIYLPTESNINSVSFVKFFYQNKYISQTKDMLTVPTSLDKFDGKHFVSSNNKMFFYTQVSADGITWDVECIVEDNYKITSQLKRYIRFIIYFYQNDDIVCEFSEMTIYYSTEGYSKMTGVKRFEFKYNEALMDLSPTLSDEYGGVNELYTKVIVKAEPLYLQTTRTVWEGDVPFTVTAGQHIRFDCEFEAPCEVNANLKLYINAYTFTGGIEEQADMTVNFVKHPKVIIVEVTAKAANVEITVLYLEAQPYLPLGTIHAISESDDLSKALYGDREYLYENNYLYVKAIADLVSQALLKRFKTPKVYIANEIPVPFCPAIELGDIAYIKEMKNKGIDKNYQIIGYTQDQTNTGAKTRLQCIELVE